MDVIYLYRSGWQDIGKQTEVSLVLIKFHLVPDTKRTTLSTENPFSLGLICEHVLSHHQAYAFNTWQEIGGNSVYLINHIIVGPE